METRLDKKNNSRKCARCVYCLDEKSISEFNRDHVIPESFGTFGSNTPTLINLVCRDCNQYFGNNVENDLGRDSLYGVIYRSMSGIINAKEFYENKRHKKNLSHSYVKCNVHGDMLVDISDFDVNINPQFMVSIANQVIIMNSTKGVQAHFRINKIPQRRFLEDIGLKPVFGYLKFYLSANNTVNLYEQTRFTLKKSDIHVEIKRNWLSEIDLRAGEQFLQFNFTINDWVMRAIAKMTFNYFILQYGNTAFSSNFNDIRNYIRYGKIPNYYIIKPLLQKNIHYREQFQNNQVSVMSLL